MDYWQKQTNDHPLFPDILWSKPENRLGRGKLLIVGGNSYGFSAPAKAYQAAASAGAGSIRIILPNSLQKTLGNSMTDAEFVPATPSGSFGREALAEILSHASWADAVLLAGDFGRNSETSILLESFVQKYDGLLVITQDAVDYFTSQPELITRRESTVIVLSLGQLQKLGTSLRYQTPFLLSMGLMLLVQALSNLSSQYSSTFITKENDHIAIAHKGKVSTTKLKNDMDIWRVEIASKAAVYCLQNPTKIFQAATTSLVD